MAAVEREADHHGELADPPSAEPRSPILKGRDAS
jgi:hypothetical protein